MSADSQVPEGLHYTKEHEWVRVEGDLAVVGLTHYAQDQLGDITYVELPEVDSELDQMGEMCVVESVKTAADVYSPLAGVVAEVNCDLEDAPELINQDCYGKGWLVKLKDFDQSGLEKLMDAAAYAGLLEEGE
jgi:glycine cleavage system H protein